MDPEKSSKRPPQRVLDSAKAFALRAQGEGASRRRQEVLAERWGVSQAAVSDALNGRGLGFKVIVGMCEAEGYSADEVLGLRAPSAGGSGVGGSTERPARRLRDLPSWPAVAERARLAVDELDAPLVDEVGGFVPPAPIERVTVALITALVGAWKGVRPSSSATMSTSASSPAAELPTVARPKTFASPGVGEARGAAEEKSGKGKRKKP